MKVVFSEERTGLAFSGFKEHDHSIPQDEKTKQNAVRNSSSSKQGVSERNFNFDAFSFNRHSVDPEHGGSTSCEMFISTHKYLQWHGDNNNGCHENSEHDFLLSN
jgi:hypothetical protein